MSLIEAPSNGTGLPGAQAAVAWEAARHFKQPEARKSPILILLPVTPDSAPGGGKRGGQVLKVRSCFLLGGSPRSMSTKRKKRSESRLGASRTKVPK